jgi:hypothetical protein
MLDEPTKGPWPTVKREPGSVTVTVPILPTVTLLVTVRVVRVRVERFAIVRLPTSEGEEPTVRLFTTASAFPKAPRIVGLGVLVLIMTGLAAVGIAPVSQLAPLNQPTDWLPVHVVVWPKAAPAKVIFRVIIPVVASRHWTSAAA